MRTARGPPLPASFTTPRSACCHSTPGRCRCAAMTVCPRACACWGRRVSQQTGWSRPLSLESTWGPPWLPDLPSFLEALLPESGGKEGPPVWVGTGHPKVCWLLSSRVQDGSPLCLLGAPTPGLDLRLRHPSLNLCAFWWPRLRVPEPRLWHLSLNLGVDHAPEVVSPCCHACRDHTRASSFHACSGPICPSSKARGDQGSPQRPLSCLL